MKGCIGMDQKDINKGFETMRAEQQALISLVQDLVRENKDAAKAMHEHMLVTTKALNATNFKIETCAKEITEIKIEFSGTRSDLKSLIRETKATSLSLKDDLRDHEMRLRNTPDIKTCENNEGRLEELEKLKPWLWKVVGGVTVIACLLSLLVPPIINYHLQKRVKSNKVAQAPLDKINKVMPAKADIMKN